MAEETKTVDTIGTQEADTAKASTPKPTKSTEKLYTQSELDALLNKQKAKYEAEKTEAAKLAKMSKDEKENYKEQQRIKDLEYREKAVAVKELKQTATALLIDKELDTSLAEILDYTNAETVKQSIDKVDAVIKAAIKKGIDDRIKGGTPRKGADGRTTVEPARLSKTDFDAYINKIKGR